MIITGLICTLVGYFAGMFAWRQWGPKPPKLITKLAEADKAAILTAAEFHEQMAAQIVWPFKDEPAKLPARNFKAAAKHTEWAQAFRRIAAR